MEEAGVRWEGCSGRTGGWRIGKGAAVMGAALLGRKWRCIHASLERGGERASEGEGEAWASTLEGVEAHQGGRSTWQ